MIKDLNGVISLKTSTGDVFVSGDVLKNITAKTATGALNFSYKTSPVLIDISFKIAKNSLCALVGPNGSGKSTLMNLLGCLDTPTSTGRSDIDLMSGTGKSTLKLPEDCKILVDFKSAAGKLFNGIGESKDYQVLIKAKTASGDFSINKY